MLKLKRLVICGFRYFYILVLPHLILKDPAHTWGMINFILN